MDGSLNTVGLMSDQVHCATNAFLHLNLEIHMSTEDCLHYCSRIKETVAFNATQIQTNTLLQMTAFRPSLHEQGDPDLRKPSTKACPDFSCERKVQSKIGV